MHEMALGELSGEADYWQGLPRMPKVVDDPDFMFSMKKKSEVCDIRVGLRPARLELTPLFTGEAEIEAIKRAVMMANFILVFRWNQGFWW